MAVNPKLPETNMSHFAFYIIYTHDAVLRNHSVYNIPSRGRVSISRFLICYIRYYLHYGFKISMLLKYNILLVLNLLTRLLNIFVCYISHDFILCFLAKHVFVIIENL